MGWIASVGEQLGHKVGDYMVVARQDVFDCGRWGLEFEWRMHVGANQAC